MPDPDEPLDPIEALRHIRTMVEAAGDTAYGTPAEATFREIWRILDRALPPKRSSANPRPHHRLGRGSREP